MDGERNKEEDRYVYNGPGLLEELSDLPLGGAQWEVQHEYRPLVAVVLNWKRGQPAGHEEHEERRQIPINVFAEQRTTLGM
jgi:hypothetical protein